MPDESPPTEKPAPRVTNSVDGSPKNVIQSGSTDSIYVHDRSETHNHDRRGLYVVGAILLVAVLVIALLSILRKDHPTVESQDAAAKPPPSPTVPIAATLDLYPKKDCESGWVVPTSDEAPIAHTDKPVDAVLGSGGSVVLTLQGLTAESVVLHSMNVEVVSRRPAMPGSFLPSNCGSDVTPRFFRADLDKAAPSAVPEPGTASFPYKVSGTDPEQVIITPTSTDEDIEWRVRIPWSSGMGRGELLIDDGGKPIRTTATTAARPFCLEQPDSRRWIPKASGASC
ncbi:hypothetical protein [Amycolatopsis orientalis]|uniref:hypothetical protein n=1 Tax=Amycolatopsis orientalis TaxID=31958 RepID=UPI0012691768|nr:hypothetical protein [Amycolatopsis orientalis]